MTPLRVEALIAGGICLPGAPIALDALLCAAYAAREGLDPPASPADCTDLPIPLAEERGVYLASFASFEVAAREGEYTNRRFPLSEAQEMGDAKLRRIQVTAGPSKSYRLPRERLHLVDDRITWWCLGDADGVRDLLGWVHYLGRKRAVGLGRVRAWSVEPCEPWPGFPVLRDGMPLRSLPLDWPEVSPEADRAMMVLRPPYWAHDRRTEVYAP